MRTRSIRTSRSSIDPKIVLRNLYTNSSDKMICQICKREMPFRGRDGNYYFEAVEAFSLEHFGQEHEAQFLALCPLCAAKYKEFVKRDQENEAALRHALLHVDGLDVPVRLGGCNTSIQFAETHRLDMKTVLRFYHE